MLLLKYSPIFTYPRKKPYVKGYYVVCPTLEGAIKFQNDPDLDLESRRIGSDDIPSYPWYYWNGLEWKSDHLPDAIDTMWPQAYWFGIVK